MLKSCFIILLGGNLLFLSQNTRGQLSQIDSLKLRISTAASPEEKLNDLLTYCDEWESLVPDTLHRYVLLAKGMAQSLKSKEGMTQVEYYLAAYLFQKNLLDSALNQINMVIAGFEKTGTYNNTYLKSYFLRGNILLRTLRYDEVLQQDLAMLPVAEAHNDTIGMIRFSTGIGIVNTLLKKYPEALHWQYKALNLMNTNSLKSKCSFVYTNLASIYDHLAQIHDTKANEDTEEVNLRKAILYSRKGKSLTILANSLGMYGYVLAEHKKLKPAEESLTEALEIRKKIGDIYYIISDLTSLGIFYENNGQVKKAIDVCLQALDLADKNGRDAVSISDIYNVLGELYLKKGDYKNYSSILNKKLILVDSMYKINSADAVAEMETKYNVQKEENVILQQKYRIANKDFIIYTITTVGVLLGIILIILQKFRRQQQHQRIKDMELENEKRTILAIESAKEEERKRIIADLHDDVGGGLSTIRMVSDLVTSHDQTGTKLEAYANKISGITRDITERMNIIVWALNTDNDTLQNLSEYIRQYGFMFFENHPVNFQSNLIHDAGRIELSGLQRKNIFLCVKESLHNIYKHSGAKNASVRIDLIGTRLVVTISDDGKGFTRDNPFGNGVKNIQKRMKEINGNVLFKSEKGTTVILQVPLNN